MVFADCLSVGNLNRSSKRSSSLFFERGFQHSLFSVRQQKPRFFPALRTAHGSAPRRDARVGALHLNGASAALRLILRVVSPHAKDGDGCFCLILKRSNGVLALRLVPEVRCVVFLLLLVRDV